MRGSDFDRLRTSSRDMSELQERTKAFLARPIPEDLDYVPDSFAERFLAQYAQDGQLTLEPETAELLALMVQDTKANPIEYKPDARGYMAESQAILEQILTEEIQRPSWPAPWVLSRPA